MDASCDIIYKGNVGNIIKEHRTFSFLWPVSCYRVIVSSGDELNFIQDAILKLIYAGVSSCNEIQNVLHLNNDLIKHIITELGTYVNKASNANSLLLNEDGEKYVKDGTIVIDYDKFQEYYFYYDTIASKLLTRVTKKLPFIDNKIISLDDGFPKISYSSKGKGERSWIPFCIEHPSCNGEPINIPFKDIETTFSTFVNFQNVMLQERRDDDEPIKKSELFGGAKDTPKIHFVEKISDAFLLTAFTEKNGNWDVEDPFNIGSFFSLKESVNTYLNQQGSQAFFYKQFDKFNTSFNLDKLKFMEDTIRAEINNSVDKKIIETLCSSYYSINRLEEVEENWEIIKEYKSFYTSLGEVLELIYDVIWENSVINKKELFNMLQPFKKNGQLDIADVRATISLPVEWNPIFNGFFQNQLLSFLDNSNKEIKVKDAALTLLIAGSQDNSCYFYNILEKIPKTVVNSYEIYNKRNDCSHKGKMKINVIDEIKMSRSSFFNVLKDNLDFVKTLINVSYETTENRKRERILI